MNTCDHDHQTRREVRLLPYGGGPFGGGGNLILCEVHYHAEMAFRRERNPHVAVPYDLPAWESLEVYGAEVE